MRFEVSRVLDAIERRLSIDPVLAGAILDVEEVLRAAELDGGRPAYLPRVGTVIDALSASLGDAAVPVYGLVSRDLLSSLEITSNEKMVLRRWADDGLIEVLADTDPTQRMAELAAVTGLPVVTRRVVPGGCRWLAPVPGAGGVVLAERRTGASAGAETLATAALHALLARKWRCMDGEVVPVPLPGDGKPTCPRHLVPVVDEGPRPAAIAVTAWVGGSARTRFAVNELDPVAVGRSPGEGVMLGPWLDEESLPWVSRIHVELSLVGGQLAVTDRSTNGTAAVCENGQRIPLTRGQSRILGRNDAAELYRGVYLALPGWRPREAAQGAGLMAEAPTVAIRTPSEPHLYRNSR